MASNRAEYQDGEAVLQPEGRMVEKEREETKIRKFLLEATQKRKSRLGDTYRQWGSAPSSLNNSVLDLTWDEDEGRSVKKRKESGGSGCGLPAPVSAQTGKKVLATKIRRTIKAIDKEVCSVAEAAKERNTKKEIKESASTLRSLLSIITTDEAQQLLQTMDQDSNSDQCEGEKYKRDQEENLSARLKALEERLNRLEEKDASLREDNRSLKVELDKLSSKQSSTSEIAMQTPQAWCNGKANDPRGEQKEEARIANLVKKTCAEGGDYKTFQDIVEYRWPDSA